MTTATRPPRRRIIRNLSNFKVGQQVTIEGDYSGDYHGTVIKTHNHLTLNLNFHSPYTITAAGVTVKVTRWEGIDYKGREGTPFAPFLVDAHDTITTARN